MLDTLLGGTKRFSAVGYIDDIIVYSDPWADHCAHLRQLLNASRSQASVAPRGVSFGAESVRYLDHVVSRRGEPCPSEVKAILDMRPPANAKAGQRFLGKCQNYRKFIPHFSIIAAPLFQAAPRIGDFIWTPEAEAAWRALGQSLSTEPVLAHQDHTTTTGPSTLTETARATASGRLSCSPRMASASLPAPPAACTTAAAVLWAFETFRHYIDGRDGSRGLPGHPSAPPPPQASMPRSPRRSGRRRPSFHHRDDADVAVCLEDTEDEAPQQPAAPHTPNTAQRFMGDAASSPRPRWSTPQCTTRHSRILNARSSGACSASSALNGRRTYNQSHCAFAWCTTCCGFPSLTPRPASSFRLSSGAALSTHHLSYYGGHFSVTKTAARLACRYWWPRLRHDVRAYLRTCSFCLADADSPKK
ncbi:hypothetical protein ACSSS7_005247 [Eimeria intestinalis]